MMKMAFATMFVVGLSAGVMGCDGGGAGEGEGEGGEGEGEGGEGEGEGGEGEGGEGEGEGGGGPTICQESCTVDADCDINGIGNFFFVCNAGLCALDVCAVDDDCNARQVGFTDCAQDSDCGLNHCIDVSGGAGTAGKCDSSEAIAGTCTNSTKVTLGDIDGVTNIDVCLQQLQTCGTDNACHKPDCTQNSDCPGQKCDTAGTHQCVFCVVDGDCTGAQTKCEATGVCGCRQNSECGAAGAAPSVCNTANGSCGCASSAECSGTTPPSHGGDVCDTATNECSCAAVADCNGTAAFSGTTFVCE